MNLNLILNKNKKIKQYIKLDRDLINIIYILFNKLMKIVLY